MILLPTLVITTAVAAAAAPAPEVPPSAEQLRQSVERSLTFLDKSGTDWWKGSKCASCHHVPISIWSLNEAKNRGFTVNEKSLDQLRDWAIPSYANHPKFKPVGQDGEQKGLSQNTFYLTIAAAAADKLDEKTAEALKKFTAHLFAEQDPDGSWKSSATLPPVGDVTEVRTMFVMLALSAAHDKGLVETARWTASRDRALAWLRKTTFIDQNQSLNLRVVIARRFGKPEELQPLVQQLLQQQNADGGWSQTRDVASAPVKTYDGKSAAPAPAPAKARPSDAMATGQSLYALAIAGVDARQPAIQRAQAYLIQTQTKDGSWRVPIRSQKNSGTALSHHGTGWATIGLMQTLPKPAKASAEVPAKTQAILVETKK